MRPVKLYQTIADRGNQEYTPIYCEAADAWLGYGYYFWDSELEDAHWWGQIHYDNFYVICESEYDYASLEYFDLLGNTTHRKYFFTFAKALFRKYNKTYTVGECIELLKRIDSSFKYKAIRALPEVTDSKVFQICFDPSARFYLSDKTRIQMCVIDVSFLLDGYYSPIYSTSKNSVVV